MPRATIPVLEARVRELEQTLERERAQAASQIERLRLRIAELRAVFRILRTTLEEGTREDGPGDIA